MDPDSYAKDLCTLADSYSAGELTPDEWRERMAALRDNKLEHWRQEQERQEITMEKIESHIFSLNQTVSMLACMIGLEHADPRFRLWAKRHLPDFWGGEFGFEIDPNLADTLLAQDQAMDQ